MTLPQPFIGAAVFTEHPANDGMAGFVDGGAAAAIAMGAHRIIAWF